MTTEPIFAVQDVLDRVDGDVEFLKELTTEFLSTFPEQLQEIAANLQTSDRVQIEKKAHALKGALKNLGAMESGSVARNIEQTAKTGELGIINALLDSLEKSVKQFEGELGSFFSSYVPR